MTAHRYCWAFEAGSIQGYLHETGRLRDAVGASQLIDNLCGGLPVHDGESAAAVAADLLSLVLKAVEAGPGDVVFSRRGGGSFIAFFSDAARRERARWLWRLALEENAPGLRWSEGTAEHDSPHEAARAALQASKVAGNFDAARLPEAGPATLRSARTGRAAVPTGQAGPRDGELLDAATVARRRHVRGTSLTSKFAAQPELIWPRNMEPDEDDDAGFPFIGASRDVAFLHADGNGLGQLLRRLDAAARRDPDGYLYNYAAFSGAVSRATESAARDAAAAVLLPAATSTLVVPARPLVLGGDDLSIIVRADLALPFAQAFLAAFERHSRDELGKLPSALGLGQGLTAACGVAFVKASHPFMAAATLAEDLCKQAKAVIKKEAASRNRAMPLSALAMQRVTTALADEGGHGPARWESREVLEGLPAYVVGGSIDTSLPRLADLQALAAAMGDAAAARGPARQLLTQLHQEPFLAVKTYKRWREMLATSDAGREQLRRIDEMLRRLGVEPARALPLLLDGDAWRTPWPDALLLRDLPLVPSGACSVEK